MPKTETDKIELTRALLGMHGEIAKIQALNEKMARGEGDYSEARMIGIMRSYLGNISKMANKLGDDIEDYVPAGSVSFDDIRGWGERLGEMGDAEVRELVGGVVPALDNAVDAAMEAHGRDDAGEEAGQRRERPAQMVEGNGRVRMDGTRQERHAGERVAAAGAIRMDGRPSGAPRRGA